MGNIKDGDPTFNPESELVKFAKVRLLEIPPDKEDLIRRGFLDVLDLELPGIVIRGFGTETGKVEKDLRRILWNDLNLFSPEDIPVESEDSQDDVGLHIDLLDSSPVIRPEITVWTIQRGEADGDLFRVRPHLMSVGNEERDGLIRAMNSSYLLGKIDPTFLVPVAHTTTHLVPRDVLVFPATRIAHAFRTIKGPRISTPMHYTPLLINGNSRKFRISRLEDAK